MLDIAPTELLLVAVVALVVIGPKDLPKAMRVVGQWIARARGVARHFRSGIDEMIRQSELEEMEKKWAAENARIMREHPPQPTAEAEPQHSDMIAIGSQPGSVDPAVQTASETVQSDPAADVTTATDTPVQKPHQQT